MKEFTDIVIHCYNDATLRMPEQSETMVSKLMKCFNVEKMCSLMLSINNTYLQGAHCYNA